MKPPAVYGWPSTPSPRRSTRSTAASVQLKIEREALGKETDNASQATDLEKLESTNSRGCEADSEAMTTPAGAPRRRRSAQAATGARSLGTAFAAELDGRPAPRRPRNAASGDRSMAEIPNLERRIAEAEDAAADAKVSLTPEVVDAEQIAAVVSAAGPACPVEKMLEGERDKLLCAWKTALRHRVVGQDEALEAVSPTRCAAPAPACRIPATAPSAPSCSWVPPEWARRS